MNKAGLKRSMSKKGYSPDNSACEADVVSPQRALFAFPFGEAPTGTRSNAPSVSAQLTDEVCARRELFHS